MRPRTVLHSHRHGGCRGSGGIWSAVGAHTPTDSRRFSAATAAEQAPRMPPTRPAPPPGVGAAAAAAGAAAVCCSVGGGGRAGGRGAVGARQSRLDMTAQHSTWASTSMAALFPTSLSMPGLATTPGSPPSLVVQPTLPAFLAAGLALVAVVFFTAGACNSGKGRGVDGVGRPAGGVAASAGGRAAAVQVAAPTGGDNVTAQHSVAGTACAPSWRRRAWQRKPAGRGAHATRWEGTQTCHIGSWAGS